MKAAFATYCDNNYQMLGQVSIPVMRYYCNKHKLTFILHEKNESQYDVYWNKLVIVKRLLSQYDWVVWCDADILIKNFDFDMLSYIESAQPMDLFVSSDIRGICLGFFVIRSCAWSHGLISTMEYLGNLKKEKIGIYDSKSRLEQDTLKALVDHFDKVHSRIACIPETIISNPKSNTKNQNCFAHHFWANSDPIKAAEDMLKMASH